MRYKQGAPVKIYVLTSKVNGEVEAFTRRRDALATRAFDKKIGIEHELTTYVQEKK